MVARSPRWWRAIGACSLSLACLDCAVPWYPEPPPYVPYEPSVIRSNRHIRKEAVAWTERGLGPHGGAVRFVKFSPDGQLLVTADLDKPVLVWSVTDRRLLRSLPHTDTVRGIEFLPNAAAVVVATERGLWLWQLDSGEQRLVAAQDRLAASGLALSADGTHALVGTAHGHLFLWHIATGERRIELRAVHQGYINAVAFNAHRPWLASAGQDGLARVWDATDGHEITAIDTKRDQVRDVAWSPDGSRLALAVGDVNAPGVWIWNADRGGLEHQHTTMYAWADALSWSPEGEQLAVARGDSLEIWLAARGATRTRFSRSKRDVNAVDWSADGSTIAYGSDDGWVRVVPWEGP